ncbi:hypothetical protein RHDE110596_17230 [Prescottella defluvii]
MTPPPALASFETNRRYGETSREHRSDRDGPNRLPQPHHNVPVAICDQTRIESVFLRIEQPCSPRVKTLLAIDKCQSSASLPAYTHLDFSLQRATLPNMQVLVARAEHGSHRLWSAPNTTDGGPVGASVVEPVDPFQGGNFDLAHGPPRDCRRDRARVRDQRPADRQIGPPTRRPVRDSHPGSAGFGKSTRPSQPIGFSVPPAETTDNDSDAMTSTGIARSTASCIEVPVDARLWPRVSTTSRSRESATSSPRAGCESKQHWGIRRSEFPVACGRQRRCRMLTHQRFSSRLGPTARQTSISLQNRLCQMRMSTRCVSEVARRGCKPMPALASAPHGTPRQTGEAAA